MPVRLTDQKSNQRESCLDRMTIKHAQRHLSSCLVLIEPTDHREEMHVNEVRERERETR